MAIILNFNCGKPTADSCGLAKTDLSNCSFSKKPPAKLIEAGFISSDDINGAKRIRGKITLSKDGWVNSNDDQTYSQNAYLVGVSANSASQLIYIIPSPESYKEAMYYGVMPVSQSDNNILFVSDCETDNDLTMDIVIDNLS